MKKKLLLAGAALLLAAAAVTGFSAYEESNISDLLDANVEALARGEGARCTGPKGRDEGGSEIYCKSENTNPCRDSSGC